MATFTTGGIAAEMAKFDGLMRGADAACEKAVKAGGKLLAQRLSQAAPVYSGPHHDVTPGALRDSIKAGPVKYDAGDGFHCEVKPFGSDHGEPLAKIGNILEYSETRGRPWFNPTIDKVAGEVTQAMAAAFSQAQKG